MNDRILDAITSVGRSQRTNYHVTLGELIDVLEEQDSEKIVWFENGKHPNSLRSYRGYYEDLAITATEDETLVEDALDAAKQSLGEIFTGYKGGEFVMDEATPLWKAEWSELGDPITEIETNDNSAVLVTSERHG